MCSGTDQTVSFMDDVDDLESACLNLNDQPGFSQFGFAFASKDQSRINACQVQAAKNSSMDLDVQPEVFKASADTVTNPVFQDICICSDNKTGKTTPVSLKQDDPSNPLTYENLLIQQQHVNQLYNQFGDDPKFAIGINQGENLSCQQACAVSKGDTKNIKTGFDTLLPNTFKDADGKPIGIAQDFEYVSNSIQNAQQGWFM